MNKTKLNKLLPYLIILIFGIIILTNNLHKPFIGHHDWNGVQYGNMARNHLRYGIMTTKLGQVENSGIVSPERFSINTHHPAIFPLMLALVGKLFGVSEAAFRLVPIFFSLISLLLIYQLTLFFWQHSVVTPHQFIESWKKYIKPPVTIAKYLQNISFFQALASKYSKNSPFKPFTIQNNHPDNISSIIGLTAVGFALVAPMFRYYANMPVHEPVITALALLVFWTYIKWRESGKLWKWFYLSNLFLVLIGWPGYYVVPIIFLIDSLYFRKIAWRSFLPLILTAIFTFCLHLLHNFWLTGSPLSGGLLEILRYRLLTTTPTDASSELGIIMFLKREVRWAVIHFTLIQLFLVASWFALTIIKSKRSFVDYLLVGILLYGITHALIFRNAAFIHEYMIYYLFPGIAIAAALGLGRLVKIFSNWISQAKWNDSSLGNTILLLIICSSVIALSFFERDSFFQALSKSNMHLIGKNAGVEIQSHTSITDSIGAYYNLEYGMIYSKFTAFYADRNIYSDNHLDATPSTKHQFAVKGYLPEALNTNSMTELEHIWFR